MINEKEFREYLSKTGSNPKQIDFNIQTVKTAINHFNEKGVKIEKAKIKDFEEYVSKLIEDGNNDEETLVGIGKYVYFMNLKDVWIYFASILGGRNILPSISDRLTLITGEDARNRIFQEVTIPPLGSSPEMYLDATSSLMKQLKKELSQETYKRVLAGNHHKVPLKNFEKFRNWLKDEKDIDKWLKRMHTDELEELEQYLREGKVWYEQIITPEILEYVRNNQEILSGIRVGDFIYNTKFPYNPEKYLDEQDALMKKYYMCHCPLAREAILSGEPEIPVEWCYCSAGYGKLRYDVAFGTETEAEVLESVFGGSDKCRFRITIPKEILKEYCQ
jgi:hypothetical protein